MNILVNQTAFVSVAVAALLWSGFTQSATANEKTRAAQRGLQQLGYDPGEIDGAWGAASRKALNEFQTSVGFRTTRSLSAGLRDAIAFAAAGAKKTDLPGEKKVGKTLIGAPGWRVYYEPNGKKRLKLKTGKVLVKKWWRKKDGTFCEYLFSKKRNKCGKTPANKVVVLRDGSIWKVFTPAGKLMFDYEMVEGNKL